LVRRHDECALPCSRQSAPIPIEHLDAEPTPQLRRLFYSRATIARFVLDLLDDTRR
jgi:hypothetical protein